VQKVTKILARKTKKHCNNGTQYSVRKALDTAKINLEGLPDTDDDDHRIATYVCKFKMKIFTTNVPLIKSKMGYMMMSMLQKKNHPEIYRIAGPKQI